MNKWIILVAALAILVGCAGNQQPSVQTRSNYSISPEDLANLKKLVGDWERLKVCPPGDSFCRVYGLFPSCPSHDRAELRGQEIVMVIVFDQDCPGVGRMKGEERENISFSLRNGRRIVGYEPAWGKVTGMVNENFDEIYFHYQVDEKSQEETYRKIR